MLGVKLPFSRASQQPLTALASNATVALSVALTIMGALRHWPNDRWFAVFIALTCEVCKLALAREGISRFRAAKPARQYATAMCCLTVATVFAVGSIAASVMCLSQAEGAEQTRTLHSTRAYASATEALQSLDAQITTLRQAADQDIAAGYRKRGLATFDRLQVLGDERRVLEAQVAQLEQGHVTTRQATLPYALALVGVTARPLAIDLALETLIGFIIELAGFIFQCLSHGGPQAPAQDPGPRGRRKEPTSIDRCAQPTVKLRTRPALPHSIPAATGEVARAPIPDTYAKWLRFDFGAPLEKALKALEGSRCHAACRDLLQGMGQHCLRAGWSNGTIDAATIRNELRGGRDWRTIEGHLARLVQVGALTVDGNTFTIQNFLAANPSVQRREARLADARSKNCKRQSKRRCALQSLQAAPLQEVDLTPSCPPHNAENPQPITHASPAAHAATHQPTPVRHPTSVDVSPPLRPTGPRGYGAVRSECAASREDDQAFQERMAKIHAGDLTALQIGPDDANRAAEAFKASLEEAGALAVEGPARKANPTRSKCIPVRIPDDPTPVNMHSVAKACAKIGLAPDSKQTDDLFLTLSQERVREQELRYAAFCTAKRRAKGALIAPENAAAYLLAIIHRQRGKLAA